MNRKTIQRERRKRYFIEAAKEIIKTRGLADVSVRNVAEAAGYSYATLYNYFSDLNDLLWHVTLDFIEEMASALGEVYVEGEDPVTALKSGYQAYVRYYLENPAVFRFLFHSQLSEPSPEVLNRLKLPLIGKKQDVVLKDCVKHGFIQAEDAAVVAEILVGMVHGLLTMNFANSSIISEEELLVSLERGIDFILRPGRN